MPLNHEQVRAWLLPEPASFWGWSEDGDCIVTYRGTTIAFHEEIADVVSRLEPHGLPPFVEIVLALAACRRDWRALRTELVQFPPDAAEPWIPHALFESLDRVPWFYEDHPALERKIAICEQLFEAHGDDVSATDAADISRALRSGDSTAMVAGSAPRPEMIEATSSPPLSLIVSVKNLRQMLSGLTTLQALELREQTGLDTVPAEAAEVPELPPVNLATRHLLSALAEERSELAGLAQVARDLMAAIHLPRQLNEPDDSLEGGFSDIANRGSLDRLLLTELAQDDEVLAARIALNEALYLQRESPPRNPPRTRAIFIDTTIRLWGLPRAFAHAAALALAATAEDRDEVPVFSLAGPSPDLCPADLSTREGLVEQLARLSPAEHPAAAFRAFLRQLRQVDPGALEPVLITDPRVLEEPEILEILQEADLPAVYLLTVDSGGLARLLCRTPAGTKLLASTRIDPNALHRRPGDAHPEFGLTKDGVDPALPAILRLQDRFFPLRVAHQVDHSRVLYHASCGALCRSRTGLLYHWDRKDRGARLLSADFPRGTQHFAGIDPAAHHAVYVVGERDRIVLVVLDLATFELAIHPLEPPHPVRGGIVAGGTVVLWNDSSAQAFQFGEGKVEPGWTVELPGRIDGVSGPFVRAGGRWFTFRAPHYPGLIDYPAPPPDLFPLDLSEAIDSQGQVWNLDSTEPSVRQRIPTRLPLHRLEGTSACGRYRVFTSEQSKLVRVDRETLTSEIVHYPVETALEPELQPLLHPHCTHRKNFRNIGILDRHTLVLTSHHQATVSLGTREGALWLGGISLSEPGRFEPVPFVEARSPSRGFQLQKAAWPDGSAAWLDSRGLLHLVSPSAGIPDITLVLKDGALSGWIADGRYFGAPYFIGEHPAVPTGEVLDLLRQFAVFASGFGSALT